MSDIQDISMHNSPTDAWVTYKGKILNVTSFLSHHPGGESIMLRCLGKDITEVFESLGHSEYARSLIPTLYLTEATEKTDAIEP